MQKSDMTKADDLTLEVRRAYESRPAKRWPTFAGGNLDRTKVVTASEIGSCLRKLWYDKNIPATVVPTKLTDQWQGMAERGHAGEAWLVEVLRHSGWRIAYTGDNQVSFQIGDLSGTPDGVRYLDDGTLEVLDFKTIDPRLNRSNLPKIPHIWQLVTNAYLVERCLEKSVSSVRVLYVNANDYNDMHEYAMPFTTKDAVDARQRAAIVMEATDAEELKLAPEGIYNNGCRFCDHKERCNAAIGKKTEDRKKQAEMVEAAKKMFVKDKNK